MVLNSTTCLLNISSASCFNGSTDGSANATELPLSNPSHTSLSFDLGISIRFTIFTGVVGFLANGVALATMLTDKKMRQQSSYFLIKYQVLLDFLACLVLIVSYTMKLDLKIVGDRLITKASWGIGVCMFFIGDGLMYMVLYAAIPDLGTIAFERYMKVVHPISYTAIISEGYLKLCFF